MATPRTRSRFPLVVPRLQIEIMIMEMEPGYFASTADGVL